MAAMVLEGSRLQKRVNGSMKPKKWLPVEDRLLGKKPEIKRVSKMLRLLVRGLRNGYAVIKWLNRHVICGVRYIKGS